MGSKFLWLLPAFWLLVGVVRGEVVSGKITLVVYARATPKLSAELAALHLSGGTLLGRTPDGGVAVQVTAPSYAAAEKKIKDAGATKVTDKVPEGLRAISQLIVSCKKGARPSDDDLKKLGLRLIERNDLEDGSLLLVKPTGPLTAEMVDALAGNPGVTHVEPNQTVAIPPTPGT